MMTFTTARSTEAAGYATAHASAAPASADAPLPAVLCVDDDPAVLRSAQRVLARRFRVATAIGPAEALDIARTADEPFAVVISDLRMPGLSGIGLLQCFRQLAPQTVRVLLSGNADLDDAVAAVNAGEIYRFLRKPYEPEALIGIVTEACSQHVALTRSSTGLAPDAGTHAPMPSVGMASHVTTLSALLGAMRPDASECAARVARCVAELTAVVSLDCADALRTAAALSQLGGAALPADVADRIYGGAVLSAAEHVDADRIPRLSADILSGAPELDRARTLLTAAADGGRAAIDRDGSERTMDRDEQDLAIGARLLAAVLRRDSYARQGIRPPASLFDSAGLDADTAARINAVLHREDATARVRTIRMGELRPGMILADDVPSPNGMLLAARGHVATDLLVARVHESVESSLRTSPVRVYTGQSVPTSA